MGQLWFEAEDLLVLVLARHGGPINDILELLTVNPLLVRQFPADVEYL